MDTMEQIRKMGVLAMINRHKQHPHCYRYIHFCEPLLSFFVFYNMDCFSCDTSRMDVWLFLIALCILLIDKGLNCRYRLGLLFLCRNLSGRIAFCKP